LHHQIARRLIHFDSIPSSQNVDDPPGAVFTQPVDVDY